MYIYLGFKLDGNNLTLRTSVDHNLVHKIKYVLSFSSQGCTYVSALNC